MAEVLYRRHDGKYVTTCTHRYAHMNTATIRISRLHQLKSESFVEFFCLDTMKFHMYQITGQRNLI